MNKIIVIMTSILLSSLALANNINADIKTALDKQKEIIREAGLNPPNTTVIDLNKDLVIDAPITSSVQTTEDEPSSRKQGHNKQTKSNP
nr:hypothetical protein [Acinetobacter sp. Marseille-Q1620]